MKLKESNIFNILNQYDLGQIKSVEPIASSGNFSFLITADSGKYFLRLSGELHRCRSKEEVEGELDLIDKLIVNNFPVIDYERTKDKQRVVGSDNCYGYLRKYAEGEFVKFPKENHLAAVGQVLGKYHNIISDFKTEKRNNINFGLERTKKFYQERKDEILHYNSGSSKEFVSLFEDEINNLNFPNTLPQGIIHEDLGKRHIIWQANKIKAIIDFDRSYFGPLVLDIGQTLRGWCFENNWSSWNKDGSDIFLAAYEKERKLSVLEKEFLVAAIKFAVLERALSFYLRFIYSNEPDQEDEKFALNSLSEQLAQIEI